MGQKPARRGRAGRRLRGPWAWEGPAPRGVHTALEGRQCLWPGALEGRGRTPASKRGDPAGVELATWPFCAPFLWPCMGGDNSDCGPRGHEPDKAPPSLHPACPLGKGGFRDAWHRGWFRCAACLCWAPGQHGGSPSPRAAARGRNEQKHGKFWIKESGLWAACLDGKVGTRCLVLYRPSAPAVRRRACPREWPREVTRVSGATWLPRGRARAPVPLPGSGPHGSLQLPGPGPSASCRLRHALLSPRKHPSLFAQPAPSVSASAAGPGAGEAETDQWGVTGCSNIPG